MKSSLWKERAVMAFVGLLFGCTATIKVSAAMHWSTEATTTKRPNQTPAEAGGGHGSHGRRGQPQFLHQGEGAQALIWLPTLVRRPVHLMDDGQAHVSGSGLDNYHLLQARREEGGRVEVAQRYLYMHGKPSGESPSLLLGKNKAALELVPNPLPREHWRYYSSKPATFVVRFNGEPLTGATVALTTFHGSEMSATSDNRGRVRFTLPEDFAEVQAGRENNRPAEFVLQVSHHADGTDYTTTLSDRYHANPDHWRSTLGGGLTLLAGFVSGLVLIRRGRKGGEA